ncbi:TetR/AcrR family transcriptional regulator [Companilactobacillus mishanensis]|uniref:TetR/AcrR family transcriptional regulator n=1 Tax=Companilactobacillus mishanensis TaxID=2486008 RepID=A0ABW9P6J3_9LACO|nr:TetR/AcrR family transcriptional regulator [Companilactobacillus mishanensis]MQS44802.1 TetR/AcrR family transcriptional regulator [Companilactobacillus mishanensis]
MTTREEQKNQTRSKILKCAFEVFSKNGFAAPTLDIAKAAGVSHGTIFVHFSTKEDLIIQLVRNFSFKLRSTIIVPLSSPKGIENFLINYMDVIQKNEQFYIRLIGEKDLLPDEARLMFLNLQLSNARSFATIVKLQRNSMKLKNIPSTMMFNTWIGLVHYYLLNKDLFSPKGSVIKKYRDELISTYLELIRVQD